MAKSEKRKNLIRREDETNSSYGTLWEAGRPGTQHPRPGKEKMGSGLERRPGLGSLKLAPPPTHLKPLISEPKGHLCFRPYGLWSSMRWRLHSQQSLPFGLLSRPCRRSLSCRHQTICSLLATCMFLVFI